MSDARRYAVWPDPRSRSRSLKGSRPSVPHGTNFYYFIFYFGIIILFYLRTRSGHYIEVTHCLFPCDTVDWMTGR